MVASEILDKIVNKIQDAIGKRLDFIVVFGSQARGNTHPLSDVDIGVKTSAAESERFEMRLKLAGLFDPDSRPRIDIVLLDGAPLTLQYRAVRDGKILFERGSEVWPCYVEQVLIRYPDWRIYLSNYLKESVGV